MILPTMTLTELAKEIQSDYKEVHARWTKFNPKFNKMRLKQTYYPWIWNTEIITNLNSATHIVRNKFKILSNNILTSILPCQRHCPKFCVNGNRIQL